MHAGISAARKAVECWTPATERDGFTNSTRHQTTSCNNLGGREALINDMNPPVSTLGVKVPKTSPESHGPWTKERFQYHNRLSLADGGSTSSGMHLRSFSMAGRCKAAQPKENPGDYDCEQPLRLTRTTHVLSAQFASHLGQTVCRLWILWSQGSV